MTEKFDNIIGEIHALFVKNNWNWASTKGQTVPTFSEVKETVTSLISEIKNGNTGRIETGRLGVELSEGSVIRISVFAGEFLVDD